MIILFILFNGGANTTILLIAKSNSAAYSGLWIYRAKEAIVEAEKLFDHPFKQYSLFEALEEKILNGDLEGYPTKISERPRARAYYGALRLGLYPDQDHEKATDKDEELADQALRIEVEIQKAKEEHSLNQLEMEKKIRSSLLADLFKICDKKIDLAKNILNNLVEMVRNQSEAKVSS